MKIIFFFIFTSLFAREKIEVHDNLYLIVNSKSGNIVKVTPLIKKNEELILLSDKEANKIDVDKIYNPLIQKASAREKKEIKRKKSLLSDYIKNREYKKDKENKFKQFTKMLTEGLHQ